MKIVFLWLTLRHVLASSTAKPSNPCEGLSDIVRKECEIALKMGQEAEEGNKILKKFTANSSEHGRLASRTMEIRMLEECMDLSCVAKFLTGKKQNEGFLYKNVPFKRATRKEIRMMSQEEIKKWKNALNILNKGKAYKSWVALHREMSLNAFASHKSPSFLPWHREHLKFLELTLRKIDPLVSIPYWDSRLDSYLENPEDSILWSDNLMGNAFGPLLSGGFKDFNVTRCVNCIADTHLFTEEAVDTILGMKSIDDILSNAKGIGISSSCPKFSPDSLEFRHNLIHAHVGGDMNNVPNAASDPIFMTVHAFVDYVWEMWRLKNQNVFERMVRYPNRRPCVALVNSATGPMWPFRKRNGDGLSVAYQKLYAYQRSPVCVSNKCQSEYLFCDTRTKSPHCVSKLQPGGKCGIFGKHANEACYKAECVNDICVQKSVYPKTVNAKFNPAKCLNGHPCCNNAKYSASTTLHQKLCPASSGTCIQRGYVNKEKNTIVNTECHDRVKHCERCLSKNNIKNPVCWANCPGTLNFCGVSPDKCNSKTITFEEYGKQLRKP